MRRSPRSRPEYGRLAHDVLADAMSDARAEIAAARKEAASARKASRLMGVACAVFAIVALGFSYAVGRLAIDQIASVNAAIESTNELVAQVNAALGPPCRRLTRYRRSHGGHHQRHLQYAVYRYRRRRCHWGRVVLLLRKEALVRILFGRLLRCFDCRVNGRHEGREERSAGIFNAGASSACDKRLTSLNPFSR